MTNNKESLECDNKDCYYAKDELRGFGDSYEIATEYSNKQVVESDSFTVSEGFSNIELFIAGVELRGFNDVVRRIQKRSRANPLYIKFINS